MSTGEWGMLGNGPDRPFWTGVRNHFDMSFHYNVQGGKEGKAILGSPTRKKKLINPRISIKGSRAVSEVWGMKGREEISILYSRGQKCTAMGKGQMSQLCGLIWVTALQNAVKWGTKISLVVGSPYSTPNICLVPRSHSLDCTGTIHITLLSSWSGRVKEKRT